MNEREFLNFMEDLRRKDPPKAAAGSILTDEGALTPVGSYMAGHAFLPAECDDLSRETIRSIGKLLFLGDVKLTTKETILILLAHQPTKDALAVLEEYNFTPDEELSIFSELALNECIMWNE